MLSAVLAAGFALTASGLARAQSAFDTHPPVDIAITAASWTTLAILNVARSKPSPPAHCIREACGPLGDGAMPYNRAWDVISYVPVSLTIAGALGPSYARWWAGDASSSAAGDSTLILAEALGVDFALTEIVKHAVPRHRPFIAYPSPHDDPARIAPDCTASFWSGHTSAAFAAAAIGAFDACRVDGPLGCTGPAVGLHALAASTALMRILAGKHHVSDVVVGAAVGSAIGSAVALTHAPKGREAVGAGHAVLGSQAVMMSMLWLW